MKLSFKTILPIILISALLILLTGCTVPDESPGYTPGAISGTIARPEVCCGEPSESYLVGDAISPNICDVLDLCDPQNTADWYAWANVKVTLTTWVDCEEVEIASTMTDENGEYLFEDIPAGKNYIITAICPEEIDFKVKDVAEEVVEGAIYDAGISDAESTVLALCLEGLGEICLDSDILDLNDFRDHFKYEKVICEVCEKLAECLHALPVWVCEITELCPGYTPTGDDDDDDPVTYNLTMLVNPTGGGATIPTVGGSPHNYPGGTVVPVSASPTTGWTFTGWSGNLSGSTNPTTILMNSNKSVTANFVEEDPCIINPPTADANGPYSDDAICGSPATIHLDGSGSSAGGTPIVSWEWSETALGALGSGETLDYDFDPGSYTVTLEVTDENNCTDTDTTTVTITAVGGPTADANGPYSDDAICGSPATIHLDGSGSSAGGTPIVSWEWSETALGALGSGETLDYDFDPGSYTVTLEVTDENNCTDTDTTTVTITAVGGPTADANGPYSDDAICGSPATIHLDGSGSSAGGTPIVSWEWSETALGALGSGETLDYDFDPGSYTVTLEVTDENNCTDTDTTTVTITAVCNDLNYLLVQGYNAESGCTGLQETHEEFTVVPNLINTGLWLYDKDHTPNVKNINFIARFDGASTLIEYRYRYRVQERDNPVFPDPEPWVGWSAWSNSGTSLGEDAYGYGFASDCMEAPSKPSNPSNYCYQFEIEIRVNGDLSTYTVHID